MKKVKLALVWVLLFFFLNETSLVYYSVSESLTECASEKAESRKECLHNEVVKSEVKKSIIKKERNLIVQDSQTFIALTHPTISVKRTILYRSIII